MVDIVINTEKFQFDFFYIDTDEKYSAVGQYVRFGKTMMCH